jgi:hypothetical protein
MHGEKVESIRGLLPLFDVKWLSVTLPTKLVLHSSNIVWNSWTQGMHVKSRMSNRPLLHK